MNFLSSREASFTDIYTPQWTRFSPQHIYQSDGGWTQ